MGVAVQIVFVSLLAVIVAFAFGVTEPALAFLIAALAWSVFTRVLRLSLTSQFRRGIAQLRKGRFTEAAPLLEASYAAFARRPWIDRFRLVLLGNASSMSYCEMALCNAAFAYAQVGEGTRAIQVVRANLAGVPQQFVGDLVVTDASQPVSQWDYGGPNLAMELTASRAAFDARWRKPWLILFSLGARKSA